MSQDDLTADTPRRKAGKGIDPETGLPLRGAKAKPMGERSIKADEETRRARAEKQKIARTRRLREGKAANPLPPRGQRGLPDPRKLDFIVFGCARSGTTAVCNYLSAARGIHCGIELYSTRQDHSLLVAPGCFTGLVQGRQDNTLARPLTEFQIRASTRAIERFGAELRHFGNKTPTYFYRLRGVLDELGPEAKAVLCWRDTPSTALSYTRRANTPDDPFRPGRTGLFAALDMMFLMHALDDLRERDVVVVPLSAIAAGWEAAMTPVVAHIAPEAAPFFKRKLIDKIDNRVAKQKRIRESSSVGLDPVDREAVDAVVQAGVDDLFRRAGGTFLLSEIRDDLAQVVARLPKQPLKFAADLAARHPDPQVAEYIKTWRVLAVPCWRDLMERRRAAADAAPAAPDRPARGPGRGKGRLMAAEPPGDSPA